MGVDIMPNHTNVATFASIDNAMNKEKKRLHGQYYTEGNPFEHPAFLEWAKKSEISTKQILEPFAGSNKLIRHLQNMNLCGSFVSYDIHPEHERVEKRDTLDDFPIGYDVCVTNPPWLAKNSATVRGLPFPNCKYDDVYKLALELCLTNCDWVVAVVPESFIRANVFRDRLYQFVSLTANLFEDTGHPVGLAMFIPERCNDVMVWSGRKRVGRLSTLESLRPEPDPDGVSISFNQPTGNVGLIALDNTLTDSIRFCDVRELQYYKVKKSGRHITKLSVDGEVKIDRWNQFFNSFRKYTSDVLLTCYKGIRKDGKYRRRLDWQTARGIIHHA